MNSLEAVFWDVDGTMADTELCGHRVAFNLAFKDFDLDWYWNEKKYLDLLAISGGLNRIVHYREITQSKFPQSLCSNIQSRKRFHYKNLINSGQIKLRDGVLRLLNELTSLGIKQYVVTTSGRDSLEPFLNTSMSSYLSVFSGLITYEDVQRHKPFPDAYKLALELSKKSEVNCLAIEDSRIGVEAAKAANIKCLLTLPPWTNSIENITNSANACVTSIGSRNKPSKLIYGEKLISNIVDFQYLRNIINS
tara:strand:- start:714 stop:1463 length:750 start_codon:yes stop_codon:yes gene_type:complete